MSVEQKKSYWIRTIHTYEHYIPSSMRSGMISYIMDGVTPVSFLCAILRNDLMMAARLADHTNKDALRNYCIFLINGAPSECFGSSHIVSRWIEHGGLNYLYSKEEIKLYGETHKHVGDSDPRQDDGRTIDGAG